jgi:putative ABC transport system permease protein
MISSFFKHSIRALTRQKSYVAINVGGLAIGIACTLLISMYIINELSYDQYHEKKNQIYQIVLHGIINNEEMKVAYSSPPFGPAMTEEYPEVQGFLRMNKWSETVVTHLDKYFTENGFLEADSSFFDFFDVELVRGMKESALNQPFTLVISESTARKIFGNDDPINQMLRIGSHQQEHRVTGVMKDIRPNTHFEANMIGSFMTNPNSRGTSWFNNNHSTYLMLHPDADPKNISSQFHDLLLKNVPQEMHQWMDDFLKQGNKYDIFLQPLTQIHHNPSVEQPIKAAKDPRYLKIFGAIGLLILIIAAINFMNLSTAQAGKRAKEVGVKKVSGSSQSLLAAQFITETVILSMLAMMVAVLLTELALPQINNLMDITLKVEYFNPWYTLPLLLLVSVVIGILAGAYPAFYLSSFDPVRVLKGSSGNGNDLINFRRILTTLQFSISIILIVGTLIMSRQINYMLNKDLGFDKENVMVIRRISLLGDKTMSFKNELLTIPDVMSVSVSSSVPGRSDNNNVHFIQGRPTETFMMQTTWADYDYLETYGFRLADGRYFDKGMGTDNETCLVNERAVKNFLIEDPLQTRFTEGTNGTTANLVIGIVQDFHFESLRNEIRPTIIKLNNDDNRRWSYISIKLATGSTRQTIEQIEETWKSFTGSQPMLWFFMNQDFKKHYTEETQNAALSVIFTILAIIIASLGLYGLTSFTIAQKTKEIGVRKTFGASTLNIWLMISREIMILIAISTALAWPLVYWVAINWLQNYHYRISLNPFDFFNGLLVASIIAMVTISYKAISAANLNPSISLRYE